MFWNKKKEIKEEKVEEINFMFCRLMNLMYKLRVITFNGDYTAEDLSVFNYTDYFHLIVETALGKRYFDLHSSDIFPNAIPQYKLIMKEDKITVFPEYMFTSMKHEFYNDIFKITAQKCYMTIEPQMKPEELTAHNIDMAVYELEQIVQKHYNICKEYKEFHENEVKKLMKRED